MGSYEGDDGTRRIGEIVRTARRAKHWKQATFARKLTEHGLPATQPIVARIENGKRVMGPGDRRIIAETLGLPESVFDADSDPLAWTEMDEWKARADLDAALVRLRDAALELGGALAFGGFDDSHQRIKREAVTTVKNGIDEGWHNLRGDTDG